MNDQMTSPTRAGGTRQEKALGRRYRGGASRIRASGDGQPVRSSASLRARLRYRFDNALSRGIWVVIGYLALLTLGIVLLATIVSAIARLAGIGGHGPLGFLEDFWQMLVRAIDSGSFGTDVGWGTRILALAVTLAGIFVAGSLIGLISSAVDQRVDALRRGRSNVLERGHTLILGWSPRVPTIVSELVVANESERKAATVVLAELDKTEMEETLRSFVGDFRTTKLVGRRGDPSSMADLELVGAKEARSILVMGGRGGDAGAIKASLAVLGLGVEGTPVIVEMASTTQADTLESVTDGALLTVNSDRVIAEVTAQACHERGLADVFRELLDFEGDELYLSEFPELVGSTYAQAQQAFEKAAVVGVATHDGIHLNPPPDRTIAAGERLLGLVEDDSKFLLTGLRPVPDVTVGDAPDPDPAEHILIVGWSALAPRVIHELDEFLTSGSRITVVVDPAVADPAAADVDLGLANFDHAGAPAARRARADRRSPGGRRVRPGHPARLPGGHDGRRRRRPHAPHADGASPPMAEGASGRCSPGGGGAGREERAHRSSGRGR